MDICSGRNQQAYKFRVVPEHGMRERGVPFLVRYFKPYALSQEQSGKIEAPTHTRSYHQQRFSVGILLVYTVSCFPSSKVAVM